VGVNRPSPARVMARRAHAQVRYGTQTFVALPPRRPTRANPTTLAPMAKRKAEAQRKPERRPRGEIDRNYFFGDVLIKTGVALFVALGLILATTPGLLHGTLAHGMTPYFTVLGVFAVVGLTLFLVGRHLRREATQWDFD